MKVLVIGSGGREHALAWKLSQSPACTEIVCAPGNPGMAELPKARLAPLALEDVEAVAAGAAAERPDLVVIGPEGPLAAGLTDRLTELGLLVLGPSQAAARLESSKSFCKDFCARHAIPSANFAVFDDAPRAKAFLAHREPPFVIKCDGLAAGKGVVIAESFAQADAAIDDILFLRKFGSAGARVVIEDFLPGEEASLFALCDGERAVLLGAAQDHKRAFDGDQGPNTGGMGAYAPAPVADAAVQERALREIILPTLRGMQAEGTPFRGILFAGLMISEGVPRLIEFNVRFGDPECQTLLPLLDSDLLALFAAAAAGDLRQAPAPRWREGASCTIVLAANGYPEAPLTGSQIRGVGAAAALPGVLVFHAGTRRDEDGSLRAAGGRVLNVTATAPDLRSAAALAYTAAEAVDWPGGFYRRDIGHRVLAAP
jgi:phosphoribosylamine--glycine ligase